MLLVISSWSTPTPLQRLYPTSDRHLGPLQPCKTLQATSVPANTYFPWFSWYSRISITRTLANSNKNRFPVDFVHTFLVTYCKNCARGVGYSRYLGTQDRGHSFSNTDRPRLVNNIFIFFYNSTKGMRKTRTAVIMARFATNCTISGEQM